MVTDKAEEQMRKGSLWLSHQEEGKATQPSAHLLPDDTLGSGAKQRSSNIEVNIVCMCPLSPVQRFCDPTDCSPPGSSVHGIFQAGILEWAAISFSR